MLLPWWLKILELAKDVLPHGRQHPLHHLFSFKLGYVIVHLSHGNVTEILFSLI